MAGPACKVIAEKENEKEKDGLSDIKNCATLFPIGEKFQFNQSQEYKTIYLSAHKKNGMTENVTQL